MIRGRNLEDPKNA